MLTTRFTELVGCTVPLQQAGMGSLSQPRLAAAVADAGGLGTVAVYGDPPHLIAEQLDEAKRLTPGVLGANFILYFVDPGEARECVAAAAERVPVIDFFYSDPDPAMVEVVHQHGAIACWQVGSAEEARAAADAGCDFIIAQSIEAGGHVRGTIGLLPLLDAVLKVVDVPVLAAGGIGSGRAMAAALAAGADGVRVGTRFVAAEEAEAHPAYVQALIAAQPEDTIYTEAYSNGWPDAPHRVLSSCVAAAAAVPDEVVGERLRRQRGERVPVLRFAPMSIDRHTTGTIAAMPHWAGESVGGVTRVQTASEIVRELVGEAERLLRRWERPSGSLPGS
jgi:NAD(P)H-dependent flavin oxidoreductase YrpB (nitropropane dioxygenase family)